MRPLNRLATTAALGLAWAVGYFALGWRSEEHPTFDPTMTLDAWIPFAGWAVWPYLLGIVGILMPAALLRSALLFRRTAVAYAIVVAVSFLVFFFLPTTANSLRPDPALAPLDPATAWAVAQLYRIDPPANLVPSMHVSLALLAALACAREYPAQARWAYAAWAILAVSVCILKQHALLDVASGILLAIAALALAEWLNPRGRSADPGQRGRPGHVA